MDSNPINLFVELLRVRQWYKNVVVALAIFFSGNVFHLQAMFLTLAAFISLCLLSSANYIINDVIDAPRDRLHPEKKSRPIAAGYIPKGLAIILAIVFLGIGIILAASVSLYFLYAALSLIVLSQLYTFWLKDILFADILTIGTLFVIRAISGAVAIQVRISPWLILCPFFLSLFLSVGKRHAELHFLKEKALLTRRVLQDYNPEITMSLMNISTTLLIISYALYSFLSEHSHLIYTLPLALFIIFRFYSLVIKSSPAARQAERALMDPSISMGLFLWLAATILILYA